MSANKKYAIIKSGGKQYRVEEGGCIDVELLDLEAGANVEFSDILSFHNDNGVTFGAPFIAKGKVKGEVVGEVSGPKITSVKYKRSHNNYRKFGHRQHYTRVKITEIAA